ncbi:MAG: hypothetical protein DRQ60_00235 [Gammaproteobacteria bacterium]|nr:MAG: hypothetical protein DRQ54_00465 [Gammaproteobacteria bacterium]RLA14783.1 MAG: hypothetical protein DRQ52_03360 [Gammaproteobacteria bacterium]RLA18166.1 MAG: hypothetical protein DRQ60_00235 [Gammaproteobacteria bacterium]
MNLPLRYGSKFCAVLLLALLSEIVAADTRLTIITLNHRPAEQLLPTIKPLIRQGDYLTGQNNKVFLRTDPATLHTVRQLISELDQLPATLLITVKQEQQHRHGTSQFSGHVNARVRDENRKTNDPEGSLPIDPRSLGTGVTGSVSTTHYNTRDRNRSELQVTVVEGYEAEFHISEEVPITEYQYGYFGLPRPALGYRSAMTGFVVVAQLNDNQVHLHVRPRKESFVGGNNLETQHLETTTVTTLGEWTQIGGITVGYNASGKGILARTNHHRNRNQSIMIKVEKIDTSP